MTPKTIEGDQNSFFFFGTLRSFLTVRSDFNSSDVMQEDFILLNQEH
jgi:hypothetical protein